MFYTQCKALHSFHVYKSPLVTKSPKFCRLLSLQTKLFAIASKFKLSVLIFRLFKVATLLNRCWVIVERNHVLTRQVVQKDCSPRALLHWFTWNKVMNFITYEIANLSSIPKFLTAVKITLRAFFFPVIVRSKPSRAGKLTTSISSCIWLT